MRTRESNKTRTFRSINEEADLESSGDEYRDVVGADAESEDAFIDDGDALDPDSTSELQVNRTPKGNNLGLSFAKGYKKKSVHTTQDSLRREGDARPPGEVQPYPPDPAAKWTRSYVGPVERWTRLRRLAVFWYGDREHFEHVVDVFMSLWYRFELLPPKPASSEQRQVMQNPWMREAFHEDQVAKFSSWYENSFMKGPMPQTATPMPRNTASRWYLPQAENGLTAMLGPYSRQKEYRIQQGDTIALSRVGEPIVDDNADWRCGGWLFDVGGIVLSMGWAPMEGEVRQLLATTVIPFSDQAYYETPEKAPPESALKQGNIQIWATEVGKDEKGGMCLSRSPPKLISALCFEWGRAVRLQWCPVPLTLAGKAGLLGLLCSDGKVRVLEVTQPPVDEKGATFEEIQTPLATLEIKGEHGVSIDCFTWININRIAAGLSDGSVAVWSIHPCRVLQRHPVHTSPIIDIVSSYPSHPFIIATTPIGGVCTVTDLNRPNQELVYCPNLNTSFQPNLLAWSEPIRGYASIWPSSFPGNNTISFLAARVYPQPRMLICVSGQPTCLAAGSCHPYVLVGSSDGSLSIANIFRKTIFSRKSNKKLKIFHHEYQALLKSDDNAVEDDETPRRVCRISQGFRQEENGSGREWKKNRPQGPKAKKKMGRPPKKKGGRKGKGKETDKEKVVNTPSGKAGTADDLEDIPRSNATTNLVVHHPLTRVTSVAWNPNVGFSWWAAAAMGSGLVRIMDLGLDQDEVNDVQAARSGSKAYDEESDEEEVFDQETSEEEDAGAEELDEDAMVE